MMAAAPEGPRGDEHRRSSDAGRRPTTVTVADVIYSALEALKGFMDKGSPKDMIWMVMLSMLGAGFTIALHECGHAVVAALTGNRVKEIRVGESDHVTISVGGLQVRLGRDLRGAGLGGYVVHDTRTATPDQILAIALAGPAANLLGAAGFAALGIRAEGMLGVLLYLWALANLSTAVHNLRPREPGSSSPTHYSDGRIALMAWEARRAIAAPAPVYVDPNAATSVAPPGQDPARATRPA
jgi:hypothetical protein